MTIQQIIPDWLSAMPFRIQILLTIILFGLALVIYAVRKSSQNTSDND